MHSNQLQRRPFMPHARSPARLELPSKGELIAIFEEAAARDEVLFRTRQALQTGRYVDADGREETLGNIRLTADQVGLLIWLSSRRKTALSVEVGFGMGSSAAAILAAARAHHAKFEHISFDPGGAGGAKSNVVAAYLLKTFPNEFSLRETYSQFGLGKLVEERGFESAALVFIDGDHHFENTMTDFVLSTHLCCVGGYIVLDDADYPAIEAVVNYVISNRPDFAVSHSVSNTAVFRKIGNDERQWSDFRPFEIPNRSDWTSRWEQPVSTPASAE